VSRVAGSWDRGVLSGSARVLAPAPGSCEVAEALRGFFGLLQNEFPFSRASWPVVLSHVVTSSPSPAPHTTPGISRSRIRRRPAAPGAARRRAPVGNSSLGQRRAVCQSIACRVCRCGVRCVARSSCSLQVHVGVLVLLRALNLLLLLYIGSSRAAARCGDEARGAAAGVYTAVVQRAAEEHVCTERANASRELGRS